MKTSVIRRATFNAAHRLHNPAWDDATNSKVFGACNNPNYHGHNYTLFVKITGEVDPVTGYVMDLKDVNILINTYVIEPLDHQNLNLDVPDFRNLNPTAENIARIIYEKLRSALAADLELKVTLYETENNIVEYPG
ncbi:MAG TPA: 6-carboxytetrahydropterin synthase [Chitinophagales bacterium]|nr:6-carboxytetrahydropterin synthase [Chitinophagales bacterium]HMU69447.1 6-carboxytetrahydropterin synthase [Chitinophagales bacterium]HMX03672.1 6-carboxytetrahydropterin synthase [Chitinophagales bacterium]HMZ87824.1 6-carboxytetrahydropterin synthase [Chitinophagales bacterium]HNA57293.1 6-carboxytetrahydropterin synthase [Chitinophagales bacterium]